MPDFKIHPLDLHFNYWPESIASFLVIGPEGPVLVETGPGSTLPTLLADLARHHVSPSDVRHVLVTHIHLDHAGASGWWAQQGATVHVHRFGAKHLIDPSKLLSSAQRIYGDMTDRLWGGIIPVPPDRVHPLQDGDPIQAGGLTFVALDTPGHARHHMAYGLNDVAFTGDMAGVRLPGRAHIQVPTVPPEFDLEDWKASLERMRAWGFARIYLTHFGPVDEVEVHLTTTAALLAEYAERVRQEMVRGATRGEIIQQVVEWEADNQNREGSCAQGEATQTGFGSISTYVDGIMRYWSKRLELPPGR